MRMDKEMDPRLAREFESLRSQPQRDPQKAALGRANFLAQAQQYADSLPPVSKRTNQRHNRWMYVLQSFFVAQRKERSPMFSTLSTILLIVTLVLGGSGITVAAAQSSQPDEGLYPVKTWSEDARLGITANEQNRMQLAMQYADRRAEEMQNMLREGKAPPELVPVRMQAEINLALQLAAGQPDEQARQSLNQIREQLRAHEQAFLDLGSPADPQKEALLKGTREMLRDRQQLCEDGIQDPQTLRKRLHEGGLEGGTPDEPGGTVPGSGPGDGDGNPWTTGTPTPGSGYGPGPGDGDGDGNPWVTGTPTPGSGNGPGPNDGNGPGDGNDSGQGNGPGDSNNPDNGGGSGNENGAGTDGGSGGESGGSGGDSGGDSGGESGGDSGGDSGGGSGGGGGGGGGH